VDAATDGTRADIVSAVTSLILRTAQTAAL
jgi:hypothetical protein